MKYLDFTAVGKELQINDYPEATKIIKLVGPSIERLKALSLHRDDLGFALEALNTINEIPAEKEIIRYCLWYGAIVRFCKCFSSSKARKCLTPEKVYKKKKEALLAFDYFKNLRNKHVVHDENAYTQSHIGAVLNKEDSTNKIGDIVALTIHSATLDQIHWSSLHSLVSYAYEWVKEEAEKLHNELAKEYEQKTYNDLNNLEGLRFIAPSVSEISKERD